MRRGILICLFLLPAAHAAAAAPTSAEALAEAWRQLAASRPEVALVQFERLAAQAPADSRPAQYGMALSLLAQLTDLPHRVERAQGLLAALAASGSDEIALGAQFALGRLAEFQATPPDPIGAAKIFRGLVAEHGETDWGQAALGRLAVLLLYTPAGPSDPTQRLAAVAALLPSARSPGVAVELHLLMADAVFHYRLPDSQALPHLLAAEQSTALDVPTRGDVWVQLGELYRLAGDPVQAARYYQLFLSGYPRDARQFALRQRLADFAAAR